MSKHKQQSSLPTIKNQSRYIMKPIITKPAKKIGNMFTHRPTQFDVSLGHDAVVPCCVCCCREKGHSHTCSPQYEHLNAHLGEVLLQVLCFNLKTALRYNGNIHFCQFTVYLTLGTVHTFQLNRLRYIRLVITIRIILMYFYIIYN